MELTKNTLGGGFIFHLFSETASPFIPEDATEEWLALRQMALDFIRQYIDPNRERIEKQEPGLIEELLVKAAELGVLGGHMPIEYGGGGLDIISTTIIDEILGGAGSFSTSIAAHMGIGMLPILYFGTTEQKRKYLPKLILGELKASYCLTEPGAGSDALAAKTTAVLTPDGTHYVLNGQKMWISNAGFADIFIVFAKVNGNQFSCFIVERNSAGLTFGKEEDKLGLKGSSTRQVFFANVHVPTENVLGEIGKGHIIAFNILNIGRYKLGAMSVGICKQMLNLATVHAMQRQQFGQSISSFGAIQYKLAEMAIRTFVLESMVYRTASSLNAKKEIEISGGALFQEALLRAAEEFAIECALLKVYGSEVAGYCADENIQIHGGLGFSEEYPAARTYRDIRVYRIYEGTNEINRLLSFAQLLKRALSGRIDMTEQAWAVQKELTTPPSFEKKDGPYAEEVAAIEGFKKLSLLVIGAAAKWQLDGKINVEEEQEIAMNCADLMTQLYAAESLLLRVMKLSHMEQKPQIQEIYDAILQVFLHDATAKMTQLATDAFVSFTEGDMLKTFIMGIRRFTKYPVVNIKAKRRMIAQALITGNGWCFDVK